MISVIDNPQKEISYIVSIGYEAPDIVTSGIVAGDLDKLTTSPPRLGAALREARKRLLDVHTRRLQKLAK